MFDALLLKSLRVFVSVLWMSVAVGVQAQLAPDDPDWRETEAPSPPAFNADKLLALDMPPYVSLKVGIDSDSLEITPDGIVRYVVVIRNGSGSVDAVYEGLRCSKAEVKTYARHAGGGGWLAVKEPVWRSLYDNFPSKHALVFARQAACVDGASVARSVKDIVRAMKK
jgi:hypothetical protein